MRTLPTAQLGLLLPLLLVLFAGSPLSAQVAPPDSVGRRVDASAAALRPPLSPLRVGAEFVAGTVVFPPTIMAVAFSPIGGGPYDSAGRTVVAFAAGTLATSLAVKLIGSAGNETGSFLATLAGTAIGTGLAVAVSSAVQHDAAVGTLLLIPIGATIGFNMTRRYD